MPVVRMPDGAQVQFPDDMPADQIKSMIATKFPEVAQPQAPQEPKADTLQRSTILPLGKDKATGEVSMAVPGLLMGAYESARDAFTAPGRAMSGELQVMGPDGHVTPEAIGAGLNFSMWASPASPASGLKMTPAQGITPKPEGLQAAEAAKRLGIDLPRAVTSDSVSVQQGAKGLTNVPIGGTPLRKASRLAIEQLDDAARNTQQAYGSGSIARAGSMARENITDFAKNTLKDAVSERYDAVDDLITQNVVTPLQNTSKVAADIMAKRQNAQIPGESKAVSLVRQALNVKDGLNYQGLKDLRTSVGELMDDPARLAASDISGGELKRIYGALTDDLKSAVNRAGGDKASEAFEQANSFAAKVAKERQALDSVLGRQTSDEGLFAKIEAMAGSTSRADMQNLLRVKSSVSGETWNEIASATLAKMGRDADGNFTPDRFLTAYGKMSENGKKALFGSGEHARALDDIAAVSRRFKQMNQFANPSGTAQNVIGPAIGFSAISEPITTLSSVVGARALSTILAKPLSAEKVAKWAKAYEQAALKPSVSTSAMLQSRARVLALEIAPQAPEQVLGVISRVGQMVAEPENQNPLVQERQDKGPRQNPRKLMPNEL